MIQQAFQQYASLREEECVMKFFNTLAGFANIDQETYRCELIVTPPLFSFSPFGFSSQIQVSPGFGHGGNSGGGDGVETTLQPTACKVLWHQDLPQYI